ncbi:MAG: ABC-F family ATP-binding cassette domain-containing protein [Alphaproteobacteria bacterium]|nr:ABC-F family ATP-binding cassette domain-containing protein [Alphaproteobacteria bacterium]
MLRIENLTYRIGARVLLDGATATIDAGHRVGLVGRNGTGKTTLFKLIIGELDSDGGDIEVPQRWHVGVTTQEAPGGPTSLIDTVLAADKELAALEAEAETATDPDRIIEIHTRLEEKDSHRARARAARILAGLGFDEEAQARPCSDFSGGWRMRVALAALLFTRPDLLLLDEPTNHLDLEASLWLEDYLRSYPGTILLISHDRDLLNRAVDEILHLENGKLTLYRGNYDRFEETRRMRLELDSKARSKQAAQRARIQAFVDRFRYKASKARQAQSRLKMLARMQPIPEHQGEGSVVFDFPDPDYLAPPLLSVNGVSVGYDGRRVLENLSLRLDDDDRIALLGANGNGKSTLAKLISGRLTPMGGEIVRSGKLRVGYFAQHQAEELDLSATPVVEMSRKLPKELPERLRAHLGRFGFSQIRAETRVGDLSGGEKARLMLALITSEKPHILVLDEPTNHLDIASREALVQALNAYKGAVVMVSHDPHMVELVADRLWLVANGKVEPFEGDMADYRALLLSQRGNAGGGRGNTRPTDEEKAERKVQRKAASADKRLRKRASDAETLVARLTARKAELEKALADPKIYEGDGKRATDLGREAVTVERDLASAEEDWLACQEELEQAAANA